MAKVVWTAEAERWLRDIHDYIAEDNPPAANNVIAGIMKSEGDGFLETPPSLPLRRGGVIFFAVTSKQ